MRQSTLGPALERTSPWRRYSRWPRSAIPDGYRTWLGDPGSLTARLVTLSEGNFRVQLLAQGFGRCAAEESLALGLAPGRWVLVRQVLLLCRDRPWVFARSLVPPRTLTGAQRVLRTFGERSLGEHIFKNPGMSRGPLEVAQFQGADGRSCWGRRSLFRLSGKPLIVSEVFLQPLPTLP